MDSLHLLLDIAIITFLAGLIKLLAQTSLDFGVSLVVSLISPLLFFVYLSLSLTSFHRHTIYTTPLSRVIYNMALYPRYILRFPESLFSPPGHNAFLVFHWLKLDLVDQVADRLIKRHPYLLHEMLAWLLRALDDDEDIERFLESIPGVYDSDLVEHPEQVFRPFYEDHVPHMILSFMHHTISSATLPDDIKQGRIRLSLQVMELDPYLLERTFFHTHSLRVPAKSTIFRCIDFVLLARRIAGNANANPGLQLLATCISAIALSRFTSDEYECLLDSQSSISTSDATSVGQHASETLDNLASLMGLSNTADP
jgi:hypothetical protein